MNKKIKNKIKEQMAVIPYNIWRVRIDDYTKSNNWFYKLLNAYKTILIFYRRYPFKHFFNSYKVDILSYLNNHKNSNNIKESLINIFLNGKAEEKMFAFCIITECGLLDNEIVEMVINNLIKSKDIGYKYWLTMEISYATFYTGKGIYKDYYIQRRKSLDSIIHLSKLKVPEKKEINKSSKILCIISYQLNPDMHNSAQRVCSMFANNLNPYYDSVYVLCLDSTYKTYTECRKYFTISRTPASNENREKISENFDKNISIIYCVGSNYHERMNDALDKLYKLAPNVIIDISDEYSPISYYYSKDFFTVCVPMRGAVTSQFYTSILGVPFKYQNTNKLFNNCIDLSKVIEWSFPEYIPPEQGTMTKHDIGVQDDQFCIISIGNNSSFSNEFIDEICRVVKKNDKMVWLLVGSNAPEYLHSHYTDLLSEHRVIEWGYENNLAGICRACDLHLRYDMTGGSGATAIAAMQGLPIVMTNFVCDASRWLGLDYSSIDNFYDLALEIQKLYEDSDYYEQRKATTLELVGKAVDSKDKWNDLYKKLLKAYEAWRNK